MVEAKSYLHWTARWRVVVPEVAEGALQVVL